MTSTRAFLLTTLNTFWDWVDQRQIVRRTVLAITVYMTYEAFTWAAHFAEVTDKTGAEVGLIIAAVTGPISLLQGFVVKIYTEGRSG